MALAPLRRGDRLRASRDLTEYIMKILTERGHFFTITAAHETIGEVKEELISVALDLDSELKAADEKTANR